MKEYQKKASELGHAEEYTLESAIHDWCEGNITPVRVYLSEVLRLVSTAHLKCVGKDADVGNLLKEIRKKVSGYYSNLEELAREFKLDTSEVQKEFLEAVFRDELLRPDEENVYRGMFEYLKGEGEIVSRAETIENFLKAIYSDGKVSPRETEIADDFLIKYLQASIGEIRKVSEELGEKELGNELIKQLKEKRNRY